MTINENGNITDNASRIRLPDSSKLVIKRKNDNDVAVCLHEVIVKFFEAAVFFLSSLVTGPCFKQLSFTGL